MTIICSLQLATPDLDIKIENGSSIIYLYLGKDYKYINYLIKDTHNLTFLDKKYSSNVPVSFLILKTFKIVIFYSMKNTIL